jgi:AMP-binding enzyme
MPGEPATVAKFSGLSSRITIDEIFRRTVERRPDALALVDPPNRNAMGCGKPRQLTYHDADRVISAIADRLRRMGLRTDSIIAVQLPNTVECVLTLLGVLRAGMIAAPLPLLWRRADAVAALSRVDVKALITCARVGAVNFGDQALHTAAEIFPIRYVCAFGDNLSDGIVSMDDLFSAPAPGPEPTPDRERPENPASRIAVLTWDVTAEGTIPVARSHMELIAGGIGVVLEGAIGNDSRILSTCAPSSYAGLSLTLVPWLLSGGTLVLHHPFDPQVLAMQCDEHRCNAVILPAPLVFRLAEAGQFDARAHLQTVIALSRAPERLASSPSWRNSDVGLVDALSFGEIGLIAARRNAAGYPVPMRLGLVASPRGANAAIPIAELSCTHSGTLTMRGPMVPHRSFSPGAEYGVHPGSDASPDGPIDTRYPCRCDQVTGTISLTGPPSGIVSIGGCRFFVRDVQRCVAEVNHKAMIAALPDSVLGHRLAASAPEPEIVRAALTAIGANPLVVGAFRASDSARANAA